MSKSDALIESKSLRESVINRTDVLDKVKKLAMLPDDLHITIEMAGNYYEVNSKTIESLIFDNKEELESDGLEVLVGERLSSFKKESRINSRAASLTTIPRRAILRIGMLLRDSSVARAVRDYLLDTESSFVGASKEIQAILMLDMRTQEFDVRLTKLENSTTIDHGQQNDLQTIANRKIVNILGGKESPAYIDKSVRGEAYSSLWNDYKGYFNINSYKNTLVKDFDKAKEYLIKWRPQGKLLRDIEDANQQLQFI